jgi:hypothetical protein
MNEQAASECLALQSTELQQLTYKELTSLIDKPCSKWVTGPDGQQYQVQVKVFWDSKKSENVRVILSIDDGGLRAFVPLTDSFIMSRTGQLL